MYKRQTKGSAEADSCAGSKTVLSGRSGAYLWYGLCRHADSVPGSGWMSACVQCAIESIGRIMRKKREMQILLIMLLTVALICGCSTKEEQNNEQKVEGVEIEEDTDTYRFVDVLGNEYEAELLDIPLITQNLTRIEDQDGKKFYLDEDGEIASRLGIDVSEYQSEVDWQQVKDYGCLLYTSRCV